MSDRNDQVFQVSLSEIAFTIAFLLMLLLGYMVIREQGKRKEAEQKVATTQATQGATQALGDATKELREAATKAGIIDPDKLISRLVEADRVQRERDRLLHELQDLDARIKAMGELQGQIDRAAESQKPYVARKEVEAALKLQHKVREMLRVQDRKDAEVAKPIEPSASAMSLAVMSDAEVDSRVKHALDANKELHEQSKWQLKQEVKLGEEAGAVRELVAKAKAHETLLKENEGLKGQMANLTKRFSGRGGLEHAACWVDVNGAIQYLFTVVTRPDGIQVRAESWPAGRLEAASALPGIDQVIAGPHTYQGFAVAVQGIYDWSRKQDPECRHFVYLETTIENADQRDEVRKLVERFFYKQERRRAKQ